MFGIAKLAGFGKFRRLAEMIAPATARKRKGETESGGGFRRAAKKQAAWGLGFHLYPH